MRNDISRDVIARVRTLRKIHKLSTQHLSEKLTALGFPISRSQLANYESGRKDSVSVDFLVHAAEALGTTTEALLTGPAACPQCKGEPPAGFTCNTCGGAS